MKPNGRSYGVPVGIMLSCRGGRGKRQWNVAPFPQQEVVAGDAALVYGFRTASRTASFAWPTALCTLPSVFWALPSVSSFLSSISLPAASLTLRSEEHTAE